MDPENPQNKKIAAVVAIGLIGLTLYWTFTYTGPFRYLAELQLKWFHFYSPKLTAMIIAFGLILSAGLAKKLLQGAEKAVPGPTPGVPAPGSLPKVALTQTQPWAQYVRMAAPLVVIGLGGWTYFNGTQAGSLQELNASDFQNGTLNSRIVYADVKGHLSATYLGKDHYLYIPMSSDAKTNSPVQLLVGVDENQTHKYLHREADGSFTVRGVADKGLAGDLKYAFEKNGIAVADPVWVVHTGREPGGDKKFGMIMVVVGIALGGFLYGLESYRKKKNAAPRPLQAPA